MKPFRFMFDVKICLFYTFLEGLRLQLKLNFQIFYENPYIVIVHAISHISLTLKVNFHCFMWKVSEIAWDWIRFLQSAEGQGTCHKVGRSC